MTDVETCPWPSSLTTSRQEQQLGSNFTGGLKNDKVTLTFTTKSHLPHQLWALIWHCFQYFQNWDFGESIAGYHHKIPMSIRTTRLWPSGISMRLGARNLEGICLCLLVVVWPWASHTSHHKMAIIQTTLTTVSFKYSESALLEDALLSLSLNSFSEPSSSWRTQHVCVESELRTHWAWLSFFVLLFLADTPKCLHRYPATKTINQRVVSTFPKTGHDNENQKK